MRKRLVIVFMAAAVLAGCRSQRLEVKAARQESALRTEELAAEVRSYARLLEQLDVEVREVTERDSAGNERRTRDVRLSRRRDAEERDTAEVAAVKEEAGALVEDVEVQEERKPAGRGWIVWGVAVAVVVLAWVVWRRRR